MSKPETTNCRHVPMADPGDPLAAVSGRVICEKCKMRGKYSNGQRMIGRKRKVLWFKRAA